MHTRGGVILVPPPSVQTDMSIAVFNFIPAARRGHSFVSHRCFRAATEEGRSRAPRRRAARRR